MKQFIYFGSFSHLAGKLMGILLNPDEKKMSIGFVHNFNVDLMHLETFVKELKDVSLGDCFGELRQVLRHRPNIDCKSTTEFELRGLFECRDKKETVFESKECECRCVFGEIEA
jgi:hypothetical protein